MYVLCNVNQQTVLFKLTF